MGAYLSEPITEAYPEDGDNETLAYGASSMQGWRVNQEDAHNAILDYDKDSAFFAVYDGHGGPEVAIYTAKKLPDFIKKNELYKEAKFGEALIDSYVEFDRTLINREIVSELKTIAKSENAVDENDMVENENKDEEEEEVNNLCEEATMPIEELRKKMYGENIENAPLPLKTKRLKDLESGEGGSGLASKVQSPFLRGKKTSNVITKFDEEGNPIKKEEKEEEETVKEESDQKNDQVVPEKSGDSSVECKKEENGDAKKETEVEKPKEEKNGEEKDEKAQEDPKAKDVKGKGKGKGKGKSSQIVKVKSAEEQKQEEEDAAALEENSPKKPKKSADELYADILTTATKKATENGVSEAKEDGDDDKAGSEELEASDDDEEDFKVNGKDSDDSDDDDEAEDDDDDEEEEDTEDEDSDEMDDDDEEGGFIGGEFNEEPGNDSGCTAVAALLRGNKLFVANAGDSRCVVCRDGEAVEMSFDHKPEDEPEHARIVKAGGKVTPDGRVNGGLNLSRAIGDHAYKKTETLPLTDQMISPVPDIKTLDLDFKRDSFMILACDGIWNSMTSEEVIEFVKERLEDKTKAGVKLSDICEELFHNCLAPDTMGDGTGCDNMTAVIVKFKAFKKSATKTEEAETADAVASIVEGKTNGENNDNSSTNGKHENGITKSEDSDSSTAKRKIEAEEEKSEPSTKKAKVEEEKVESA